MNFPDESFDIVWTEGAIFVIGFEKGIKEWRRFIKPNGFLVVHDEISDLPKKLKLVPICGYNLIEHFVVSKDVWWNNYYYPLEKRIQGLRIKYRDDHDALVLLDKEQHGVDEFKKNPKHHGSVFFVMQKS
jgi:SAM-dependent methyltransferase